MYTKFTDSIRFLKPYRFTSIKQGPEISFRTHVWPHWVTKTTLDLLPNGQYNVGKKVTLYPDRSTQYSGYNLSLDIEAPLIS